MKLRLPLVSSTLCAFFFQAPAFPQAELVRESLFPAELEFKELKQIQPEQRYETAVPKQIFSDAALFEEAGLKRYSRRTYELLGGGLLKIEILDLGDRRASFSMLTLLRKSDLQKGPPGDYFVSEARSLVFSQESFWVQIGADIVSDLPGRVGLSVSNRIGKRDTVPPPLASHLPRKGLNRSTLRYFLGKQAFDRYGKKLSRQAFEFSPGMEVLQAQYLLSGQSGVFSLISFPTGQLAEDFFNQPHNIESTGSETGTKTYGKRAGPLVAILDGNFSAETADTLLSDVKFAYSIKWIYDKNNRSSQTIWGIPVGILGTVVRSLVLVALLCLASAGAGLALAIFRIALRGYAPNNFLDRPERTEMIRLKINEN
jgi:hypothetical protein